MKVGDVVRWEGKECEIKRVNVDESVTIAVGVGVWVPVNAGECCLVTSAPTAKGEGPVDANSARFAFMEAMVHDLGKEIDELNERIVRLESPKTPDARVNVAVV